MESNADMLLIALTRIERAANSSNEPADMPDILSVIKELAREAIEMFAVPDEA